ncbi:MAG: cytidine deaminase [Nonlabens sp.]
MVAAIEARNNAYAPYSNFLVGCALLLDNGKVIKGNNQENAAYPSGLCAERVAIFAAGANHPGIAIKKIAITAGPRNGIFDKPVPPCGACRQSIAEYENNQDYPIELFFMGTQGTILRSQSMKDLLPLVFDRDYL